MNKKTKFTDSLIYILFITYIFYELVTGIIGSFFENVTSNSNSAVINIIHDYLIYTIPCIILFLALMYIKKNRYMYSKFKFKNNKIFIGLLIGFIMNSFCIMVAHLSGSIIFSFNYINIPILLFSFISIGIQSASEEIVCRLFLYEKILKKYNKPVIAIIINSLFFSLTHLYNEGITLMALISIFGMGIVTSLTYYYNNNIWEPIAIHTCWNFTQNFIFGLPNSGIPSSYSIFKLIESKNSFAYNSVFGIEATYIAIATLLITSVLIYLFNYNKKDMNNKF
ncbi:MAG: lysostaphin resistance A-like protein [Bacilli bacterium]